MIQHSYLFRSLSRFVAAFGVATCLVGGLACRVASAQELLGYWQLEETDIDTPAADASGNGLVGLYEGDVDPNVDGAPGFGSGAYFDGVTSQVLIEGGADIFGPLTNDFTVMAWVNVDQFDRKNRIFGGSPVGGGWGFGTVRDELEITTYGVRDYDQPVPLELDVWTHVAVALDANNDANFYVNGEFVGVQSHGAPGNPIANEFYIGASCCATESFEGEIDEVGVFRGTLNETQVFNAMQGGVDNWNGGLAVPPVAIGDRGGIGSEAVDGMRQNLVFGEPSGDPITGLGQSWYQGTAGNKAAFDSIASGERAVPFFQSEEVTWWAGSNSVTNVQDYPSQVDGVITGDGYSVKLEGEILIEQSGVIRFLDGVDDYTYLAIDLDRSGVAGDTAGDILIDDNDWTDALSVSNTGAEIVEADFQDIAEGGEWLPIEFNMSEGGGGDSGMLYWDVFDEFDEFPTAKGVGVPDVAASDLLVPETHLRSPESPAPLVSGDVAGTVPTKSSGWEVDVNPADGTSDVFDLANPDADTLTTIMNVDGIELYINALSDPAEGDSFRVFLADMIEGTPTIATEGWSFDAATGSIVFGTSDPFCDPNTQGDLDGNGQVEFADFLILSDNFGNAVAGGPADGDIDCSGVVEFADFLVLSENFGNSVAAAASVPEPSGWALFCIASLGVGLVRRKR